MGNHLNRNHEKIDEKNRENDRWKSEAKRKSPKFWTGRFLGLSHPISVPNSDSTMLSPHLAPCRLGQLYCLLEAMRIAANLIHSRPVMISSWMSIDVCRLFSAIENPCFAALHRLPHTSHFRVTSCATRRLCTCQSAPGLAEGESNPSAPSSTSHPRLSQVAVEFSHGKQCG